MPTSYVAAVLFYSVPTVASSKSLVLVDDHLKISLSNTLARFYPFAGRLNSDGCSVDCNDRGAVYIRAQVPIAMSALLKQTEVGFLEQLLPLKAYEEMLTPDDDELICHQQQQQPILLVQVNFFACGGIAIGVAVKHNVSDASPLASILVSWAAMARRGAIILEDATVAEGSSTSPVTDCTFPFPPLPSIVRGPSGLMTGRDFNDTVTKRFVFDGSKLASLREKIIVGNRNRNGGVGLERPSHVEALSALIWRAAIAIAKEKSLSAESLVALNSANLRRRMSPPLPEKCMGSLVHVTTAEWPVNLLTTTDHLIGSLAAKLRESTKKIDDGHVRKMHNKDYGYLDYYARIHKIAAEDSGKSMFTFSSWCRFGLYKADFGRGKPVWVATSAGRSNCAILMDTKDGEGIEALASLTKEDMAKFEQDPDIVEYAS